MSLTALPAELQLMICRYLSRTDLATLVLCSKDFHFASLALYEDVSIDIHTPTSLSNKVRRISQLADLLSKTEALASLVKVVRLTSTDSANPGFPPNPPDAGPDYFRCHCILTAFGKHGPYCNIHALQPARFTSILQKLLDACPNLRELIFSGFTPSTWAHGLNYSKMQELRAVWIMNAKKMDIDTLEQLATLPHLERFGLSFDGFCQSGNSCTLPVLKALTTLKIVTRLGVLGHLQMLLRCAPNLTYLDLEIMVDEIPHKYVGAGISGEPGSLSELGMALRGQLGSPTPVGSASTPLLNLEYLRLAITFARHRIESDAAILQRYGRATTTPQKCRRKRLWRIMRTHHAGAIEVPMLHGKIGPLTDLHKLETLEISPSVLIGRRRGHLMSQLPESLRELRLRDDPITWGSLSTNPSGYWIQPYYRASWTPAELDSGLKGYSEAYQSRVPHLEKIVGLSRLVRDAQVQLPNEADPEAVRVLADLGIKYEIQQMVQ